MRKKPPAKILLAPGAQSEALTKSMHDFAEGFRTMRVAQFNSDREAALRSLSLTEWRTFSLRWNIAPSFPYGFNNEITQWAVIHRLRCVQPEFSNEEKLPSAQWLIDNNFAEQGGISIVGGVVVVSTPAEQ